MSNTPVPDDDLVGAFQIEGEPVEQLLQRRVGRRRALKLCGLGDQRADGDDRS